MEILFIEHLVTNLDSLNEPLEPLGDGPRHAQRHLGLEDVEHGKDKQAHGGECPIVAHQVPRPRDEPFALAKGVLGVVGRFLVV